MKLRTKEAQSDACINYALQGGGGRPVVKQIEVVAAIIHDSEGRIFATQRGYGERELAAGGLGGGEEVESLNK